MKGLARPPAISASRQAGNGLRVVILSFIRLGFRTCEPVCCQHVGSAVRTDEV